MHRLIADATHTPLTLRPCTCACSAQRRRWHPGLAPLPKTTATMVFKGIPENVTGQGLTGTYQHGAMISYTNQTYLLTWKNSPVDEDEPGQRILYSTSPSATAAGGGGVDGGGGWSAARIMFPNITTPNCTAILWGDPHITLNGHLYAAASVMQICLYVTPPGPPSTSFHG